MIAPDLGPLPQAFQGIRGLTLASDRTLATSIASARSDIWMVEGFERPPSLLGRLFLDDNASENQPQPRDLQALRWLRAGYTSPR